MASRARARTSEIAERGGRSPSWHYSPFGPFDSAPRSRRGEEARVRCSSPCSAKVTSSAVTQLDEPPAFCPPSKSSHLHTYGRSSSVNANVTALMRDATIRYTTASCSDPSGCDYRSRSARFERCGATAIFMRERFLGRYNLDKIERTSRPSPPSPKSLCGLVDVL